MNNAGVMMLPKGETAEGFELQFGTNVLGRPALCMMTSNVFGSITAENLGYSKVSLEQTIADGKPGCRVVVYLKHTPESEQADGREYFQA